jgi:negative regulator of sigma E activity
MSDDRHEEIAARLRAEAGVRAPERLQADVMLRVRAEPRPRRIRPRHRSWRPLGSLAAAACVLAALVFGVSHLNLSNGASSSSAGGTEAASGPLRAAAPGGGASTGFRAAGNAAAPSPAKTPAPAASSAHRAVQGTALARNGVESAPRPLWYALYGRAALASPLPKALGTLDLHRGHGSH